MEEKRNSKQAACQPIADLLSELVRDCRGRAGTTARAVWEVWDGVVGETVAGNAQPTAFKERLLIVHVSSSAWLQELHFQKADLIRRLNRAAGATVVEEIRFKIGTLPAK